MIKELLALIGYTKTIKLPKGVLWDEENERLYCMSCWPSHTKPGLLYLRGIRSLLEDPNISSFIKEHTHV